MGRKNVVKSFKMIDSEDLSGNITSSISNVTNLDKASIAVSWTGSSPSGTIEVQSRNGEKEDWVAVDMGATISVSGASGSHSLVFTELPWTDIRLTYTAASGSGTLDAVLTSKVVGA